MKKLLSLTLALAISLSSMGMFAAAAPNRFGVETESQVDVGLDIKIKGASGTYGDYDTEANPLTNRVSSSNPVGKVNAKATIDMTEVAAKWNEYITAGANYIATHWGFDAATARAAVLEYTDLSDSSFTITITADSAITNPDGADVELVWSDAASDLFEQDGVATYTEGGNTVYTVNMKIKADNEALDEYFTSDNMGEISLEIADSEAYGIGGPYPITAEFTGTIAINVPDDDDMTVTFTDTDISYVKQIRKPGGSVTTPTEAPTDEPTEAPTETPAVSAEPQTAGTANGATLNYEDHYAYIIGYDTEDGTSEVRPENPITRAEVATIFYRLLTEESRAKFRTQENEFTDVNKGDWYNNGISTVAAAGIVNGYDDGTFRPDNKITRAEFAMIASRFSSLIHEGDNLFTDTDGHWAKDAINNAAITGWVNGYDDGTFKPDAQITRAEAITLINRVLYRYVEHDDLHPDMITWVDNTPDKWYYTNMQEATNSHDYDRTDIGYWETHTVITEPRDWSLDEK